jgi:hypothetical protein
MLLQVLFLLIKVKISNFHPKPGVKLASNSAGVKNSLVSYFSQGVSLQ